MSRATKGPWDVERFERDVWSAETGHTTIPCSNLTLLLDSGDETKGCNYIDVHGPNQEANARLVSAAPEMFNLLSDLYDNCTTRDCNVGGVLCDVCKEIAKVLDKAEGKP